MGEGGWWGIEVVGEKGRRREGGDRGFGGWDGVDFGGQGG